MTTTSRLIESFYQSFGRRDADGMVACYHDEVRFTDPVFPELRGEQAKAMWQMLCERGTDLQVEFSDVVADDRRGTAVWVATYTFSATKRPVVNRVEADFRFRDGLIIEHSDFFDFWRWSAMALGFPGRMLGWSALLQGLIRKRAARELSAYIDGRSRG